MKAEIATFGVDIGLEPWVTADLQASTDVVHRDLDWLVRVGVVRIVDKLIEHPSFTKAVSLIRHFAFVDGAESVRNSLVGVGVRDAAAGASSAGPTVRDLDIQGIRDLCIFSGSEGTPEAVAGNEGEIVQLGEHTVGSDKCGAKGAGDGIGDVGAGDENMENDVIIFVGDGDGNEEDANVLASCATPPGA
ncbi:unnamed protein product [Lactuca virosa]|uniref:Uncharacterized protein n=1 Tax=Lactuca virosa TaxID=75947 RepID=A0AAU9LHV0_9ASTR|nr:unnamed protein product [Lactuca virosa]